MAAFALGFNRSTQHLDSSDREEDVADEAKIENILHRTTEIADVGSLAERRVSALDSAPFWSRPLINSTNSIGDGRDTAAVEKPFGVGFDVSRTRRDLARCGREPVDPSDC